MAAAAAIGGLQLGLGILQMDQASKQAKAERELGKYQQQIFNINADNAEKEAQTVISQGEQQATRYMDSARSVGGKQDSAYAAQGVDVSTGVARDVKSDTVQTAMRDVLQIKDNAWRASWGLKQEAADLRRQGRFAAMGGKAKADATLATGGLNFVNSAINAGSTVTGYGKK
jgi:hypothetical protein